MRFRASKSVDCRDTQWCFVWLVSFGIVITVWEAVGCALLLCIPVTRPFSEMRGIILGDFAEIWLTRLECCIQSNCSNFDTPTSFTAQYFIAWPIVATILYNNLNLCSLFLPRSRCFEIWNLSPAKPHLLTSEEKYMPCILRFAIRVYCFSSTYLLWHIIPIYPTYPSSRTSILLLSKTHSL